MPSASPKQTLDLDGGMGVDLQEARVLLLCISIYRTNGSISCGSDGIRALDMGRGQPVGSSITIQRFGVASPCRPKAKLY